MTGVQTIGERCFRRKALTRSGSVFSRLRKSLILASRAFELFNDQYKLFWTGARQALLVALP